MLRACTSCCHEDSEGDASMAVGNNRNALNAQLGGGAPSGTLADEGKSDLAKHQDESSGYANVFWPVVQCHKSYMPHKNLHAIEGLL